MLSFGDCERVGGYSDLSSIANEEVYVGFDKLDGQEVENNDTIRADEVSDDQIVEKDILTLTVPPLSLKPTSNVSGETISV